MPILIAGIGNIFHGDDAFGCEVAQRLMETTLPDEVQVIDFGIRSYDLAYALMDGYDAAVLVDATPQGRPPGTVFLMEPDLDGLDDLDGQVVNAHSMNPARVLHMVETMGGEPGQLYLIGCEPAVLEAPDGDMGLSDVVERAVPEAIEMIRTLADELLRESVEVTQAEDPIREPPNVLRDT